MAKRSHSVSRPVRVTFSGTNPSASAVTIKKEGTDTTDSVGASEQMTITDFELISSTGGACSFLGGTGAQITKGTLPSTGGGIAQNNITRKCVKGTPPTVTGTGQVDLTASGYISAAPTT